MWRFISFHKEHLARLIPWVLLTYFAVYFLVPYKPWGAPVSFHTPILGVGLVLSLINLFLSLRTGKETPSKGLIYLGLAMFFFFVSFLVNMKESSVLIAQAYAISLASLFFVGRAINEETLPKVYFLMKVYLIISGGLILLQVDSLGLFYVATYLGALNPPIGSAGWGFASSHIFAGGTLSWMFCVLLSDFAISYPKRVRVGGDVLSLFALGFGAVGIFYTFNRGAWIAVFISVCVLWGWLLCRRLLQRRFVVALLIAGVSVVGVKMVFSPAISRMEEKLSFMSDVVRAPAEAVTKDASSLTRLTAWGLSLRLIKSHPVWGVGTGRFPILYSRAFPQLYKGLAADRFDPYPIQTSSNSYLYYAVELGLLPSFFLMLYMIWIFYVAVKGGESSAYYPFFIGGICMFFWLMTCDYIGERIFWIGLGVMAGPAMGLVKTDYAKVKRDSLGQGI